MAVSYYEVLGVASSASPEEIRRAYRHRARALHPDRQAQNVSSDEGPDAALRSMQVLNEAWQVLGDRERRGAYDRLLADTGPAPSSAGRSPVMDPAVTDDRQAPLLVPGSKGAGIGVAVAGGLPWIAVLVVLGAIFVFTAFAGNPPRGGDPRSASALVGHCVQLERGGVVTRVPCDGPSDGRVDLLTVRATLCPDGTDVARLPGQRSWLCLGDPSTG